MDINKKIGKIEDKHLKYCRRIMTIRRNKRKKDIPVYQKIATDIIMSLKNIFNFKIQTEKLIYCQSTQRFYLIDVYIPKYRLAIELDGNQHIANRTYDEKRSDALLNDWGIFTMRFPNKEVVMDNFKSRLKILFKQFSEKPIKGLDKDLSIPLHWGH